MPIVLRGRFWDDRAIEWYYRQNMLLYVREDRFAQFAHAFQPPLDIVAPEFRPVYVFYFRPNLSYLFRSLPGAAARSFKLSVISNCAL